MFRYQALQAHQAGVPVQVRAYLALLKFTQEDAVNPPRQEPGEVRLSHGSGSLRVAYSHLGGLLVHNVTLRHARQRIPCEPSR